jgi:hypothetical protein
MNKAPKPRRCKVCETVFTPKQFYKPLATINAITYAKRLKENKAKADWKIEKKALTKLKTLSQYEADAKKSFKSGYGYGCKRKLYFMVVTIKTFGMEGI